MLGLLLAVLKGPLGRVVAGVAAGSLMLVWAYHSGGRACAAKQAKLNQQWAARVTDAALAAYDRGVKDATRNAKNDRDVDQIVRDAGMEAGADDVCISADIAARLRDLN